MTARGSTQQRATAKRTRATRSTSPAKLRRYSDEERTRTLEAYRTEGLPAAVKVAGAQKSTIVRWARAAGVAAPVSSEELAARTAAANAERHRIIAESKEEQARSLALTARALADLETYIAGLARRAIVEAGQPGGVQDRTKAELAALQLITDARLQRIVGMRTRAVHDLQLLTGEDTERGGAGASVQVLFATPPADGQAGPPVIIDLTPAEEAG